MFARRAVVSPVRWRSGGGSWFPALSWRFFTVCPCQEKEGGEYYNNNNNKNPQLKEKLKERGRGRSPAPQQIASSTSASSLLVVVVFLLLAVGQRGAGADLPVAVQPLLHHLSDERVVAAAGAFLKRNQNAALCHAAVQPLPQELLLLLFITHLKDRRGQTWPSEGALSPHYSPNTAYSFWTVTQNRIREARLTKWHGPDHIYLLLNFLKLLVCSTGSSPTAFLYVTHLHNASSGEF